MPVGGNNNWSSEKFVSVDEILHIIQSLGALKPILKRNNLDGPAQRYILEGGKGEIGLIGALSNHFCDICNRLRLTADGHLRSCLFSDNEVDLKKVLREKGEDDHILALLEHVIDEKPKNHGLLKQTRRKCIRQMSSIGG
jgi:cyclic pyranopterin phosphate synthase